MTQKFTRNEIEKIAEGTWYILNNEDSNPLHKLVYIVGAAVLGKIINRTLNAAWYRVTTPEKFSYGEIKSMCLEFGIPFEKMGELLDKQIEYNATDIKKTKWWQEKYLEHNKASKITDNK